jgi:hypothetical protein
VHRLEYQVRNQKALIESVVDAAPVVIALLDIDDRVVLDNHEYKKLQADLGMAEPAPMLMSAVRASLRDSSRPGGRRTSGYRLPRSRGADRSCPAAGRRAGFPVPAAGFVKTTVRADAFLAGQGRDYLLLVAKEITSLRVQQEKIRVAALQAVMAEEDRLSALRESLVGRHLPARRAAQHDRLGGRHADAAPGRIGPDVGGAGPTPSTPASRRSPICAR